MHHRPDEPRRRPSCDALRVPSSERRVDRGRRLARRALNAIGDELRESRIQTGLSQREVGSLVGLSHSEVGRIERGLVSGVPFATLATLGSVVGLDIPLRAYPNGDPVRDAAQLALLARFRALLPPELRYRAEVPLGIPGDLRAWDGVIVGHDWTLPIEAETRLRDMQALLRRLALKARDGAVDRMLLVVKDSRHNRLVLRLASDELSSAYPIDGRSALRSLQAGLLPVGSAILRI